MKRLFWLLPLCCILLFGCGVKEEETPPWLYLDKGVTRPKLRRFDGTVQEGKLTEVEYSFPHPDPSKRPAVMIAAWKPGDEEPVCTELEIPQSNDTLYLVENLPLCLRFLEHLPETPPEDCRISIWMPEEEELEELLAENDYLIGRVGAGEIRTPQSGEVPAFRWQIDRGNVLFGVLLVEDSNGDVVSFVLLEGTIS